MAKAMCRAALAVDVVQSCTRCSRPLTPLICVADNVKEGVEAHFVDTYQDVFNLALGSDADHSSGDYGFTDSLVFPKDEQHRPDAATAA